MVQWIPVLVRVEDYREITALVAQREATRTAEVEDLPTVAATPLAPGAVPTSTQFEQALAQQPVWGVEDLRRLARGETLTTQRWTRAMDVCAQNPGSFLTTSQVAQAAGMSINEWRDAPRKISRHLQAHYPAVPRDPNGDPVWPLYAKTMPDKPDEVSWAISEDTARRWHEVRTN